MDTGKFKQLAKGNMPFMALQIHGVEDVEIKPDLPHSENMLLRGITIKTVEDLMKANLEFKLGGVSNGGMSSTESVRSGNGAPEKQKQGHRPSIAKSLTPITEPESDEEINH